MPQLFKQLIGIIFLVIFGTSCGCITLSNLNDFKNAPRGSFVKIETITTEYASTGSGVIIHHSNNSKTFILTAGHICDPNTVAMRVLDLYENKYNILSSIRSNEDDLCILIADGNINGKDIKIAESQPEIGEHVYNISAPRSLHSPNMSLMFDGYYQGQVSISEEKNNMNIYSIVGMGGSSGSPVFNEDWELIGIVSRGIPDFQHVMLCVSHERTSIFYNYILSDQFIVDLKHIQGENQESVIEHANKIIEKSN
jgi:S1-C subfamily serine protease